MSKLTKALTAAAGNAGGDNLYVEDVFSTYLYTGTQATQSINNGIDLDGEGGLVWVKTRQDATDHFLYDTERGVNKALTTNKTSAENSMTNELISFNSDGFTLGSGFYANWSAQPYASWTFRKAEKFFDVVTYTGDGTGTIRDIPHNLGVKPSMVIIKRTDASSNWKVGVFLSVSPYNYYLHLNETTASGINTSVTEKGRIGFATDSIFRIYTGTSSTGWDDVNASGGTYVAYVFGGYADDGGFGDDGDESIIKCGSLTIASQETVEVDCGFETQFVLLKNSTSSGNWFLFDTMRGMAVTGFNWIFPNLSGAEEAKTYQAVYPTSTGFGFNPANNGQLSDGTYIYIAIRRPMKTPESGTEVFKATELTSPYGKTITTGWPVDMTLHAEVSSTGNRQVIDRLRGTRSSGPSNYLSTNLTDAEAALASYGYGYDNNTGYLNNLWGGTDGIFYDFKRATGFFDVVAYTGTGVSRTVAHNLGVVPELMIVKTRNAVNHWNVYHVSLGNTKYIRLNSTNGSAINDSWWDNTSPTDSVFTVFNNSGVNASGSTYISYLFATLDGVSKVGSYTGTGSNVDVDCGFSAGARFILIKRTDSTGDWYVWDSERGIVAGNDPYLLLNSTAAEVTSTDYIDPLASGFTVTSSAPAALNASGGSYIFLAIS